jgi:hypothetical protein
MTNQQEQITPPPELRRQWLDNDHFPMVTGTHDLLSITRDRLNSVIDQAAQWGADQELEACCEWITGQDWTWTSSQLRAARRPKPPSLKEQALERLELAKKYVDVEPIRRALEALDD